ncbi:hypothetical protein QQ045_009290 [Rhodiola kirilowii]
MAKKLKELLKVLFYKPMRKVPSCFLNDFINASLPFKALILLHLDEKPQLVIIKRDGHAVNVQKPKQIYKHIKEFLVDPKQESKDDGNKVDDAKKSE